MKSFFDKLNLRPQERRMVVIVGVIIFIVINVVFVMPIFGEYGKTTQRMKDSHQLLNRYETEIKKKGQYEQQLRQLESSGSFVAQEEQASKLMSDVTSQATLSGVTVLRYDPTPRVTSNKTNSFFEEQSLMITVNTGEKELVEFLYNLGSGGSLVRVRSMTLNPEVPNRYKLQGNLTLVESFQKKPPAKPVVAPSPAPAKTNAAPAAAKRDAKPDAKPAADAKNPKKTPAAK
jgi:Tfp pilus assembly protein PilO